MNAALLNQINSGKALRKVPENMKNDRSAALVGNSHQNGTSLGKTVSGSALIGVGFFGNSILYFFSKIS